MSLSGASVARTVDAFHRGRFVLVQPADGGHRAGMDAMMLAAAVPSAFAGRLADFGAGAGAAGLAVLSRCAGATAVLIERSPEMIGFAEATLAHPANADFSERAAILQADVTLAGQTRVAAGLADRSFDFVIMNPPFNAGIDRATPDALRKEAHVMDDGLFERWLRSAAAVVRPRGGLAVIARPEQLAELIAAVADRFGSMEVTAIHPRADAAAIRIVLRAWRGSRAKLSLKPPLVMHEGPSGRFSPRADAVGNGFASLFGD